MNPEHVVRLLDWFVLEGGDPCYERPIDDDGEISLSDEIHEIRFPEFEIYIGPSISGPTADTDVAVLLRPAIAVEPSVADSIYRPHLTDEMDGLSLEFRTTDDGRDDTSVWLVLRLSDESFDDSSFDTSLTSLMRAARRMIHLTTD